MTKEPKYAPTNAPESRIREGREPKYAPTNTPRAVPDEAAVASNIRLMAERLGMTDIGIQDNGVMISLFARTHPLADVSIFGPRATSPLRGLDALLAIHEQLRAELLTRIALDHDVLTRVRGTHAIRRRRDAVWYAGQSTESTKSPDKSAPTARKKPAGSSNAKS